MIGFQSGAKVRSPAQPDVISAAPSAGKNARIYAVMSAPAALVNPEIEPEPPGGAEIVSSQAHASQ